MISDTSYDGPGQAFMNASPEGLKRRKEMAMNVEDPAAIELPWSLFASWMGKYLSPAMDLSRGVILLSYKPPKCKKIFKNKCYPEFDWIEENEH